MNVKCAYTFGSEDLLFHISSELTFIRPVIVAFASVNRMNVHRIACKKSVYTHMYIADALLWSLISKTHWWISQSNGICSIKWKRFAWNKQKKCVRGLLVFRFAMNSKWFVFATSQNSRSTVRCGAHTGERKTCIREPLRSHAFHPYTEWLYCVRVSHVVAYENWSGVLSYKHICIYIFSHSTSILHCKIVLFNNDSHFCFFFFQFVNGK